MSQCDQSYLPQVRVRSVPTTTRCSWKTERECEKHKLIEWSDDLFHLSHQSLCYWRGVPECLCTSYNHIHIIICRPRLNKLALNTPKLNLQIYYACLIHARMSYTCVCFNQVIQNIGVRRLSDSICESKVLLIGHSHFLDLLHLFNFYRYYNFIQILVLLLIPLFTPNVSSTSITFRIFLGAIQSIVINLLL